MGIVEEPVKEKRYYIKEVDEGFHKWNESITETEFKRRFIKAWTEGEWDWDEFRDILLHGEEQQETEKQQEPTREDWEKWADKIANKIAHWWPDVNYIKQIFLSMPCVPKE
jgi:hypothetical protein